MTRQFPELTTAQAGVLALSSFGMVLAQASGLSVIALTLGVLMNRSANTVRQQLRELYQPAQVKSGRQLLATRPTSTRKMDHREVEKRRPHRSQIQKAKENLPLKGGQGRD